MNYEVMRSIRPRQATFGVVVDRTLHGKICPWVSDENTDRYTPSRVGNESGRAGTREKRTPGVSNTPVPCISWRVYVSAESIEHEPDSCAVSGGDLSYY